MGFKIWYQVGELRFYFKNSYGEMCFWQIILKVSFKRDFFVKLTPHPLHFSEKDLRFSEISFKGISFVKLTPLNFLSTILRFSDILFKGISFVKLYLSRVFNDNMVRFVFLRLSRVREGLDAKPRSGKRGSRIVSSRALLQPYIPILPFWWWVAHFLVL